MRPTIVLLCAGEDCEVLRRRITNIEGYVRDSWFDRFQFRGAAFGVSFSQDIVQEYDEDELEHVRGEIGEFSAVLLEYQRSARIGLFLAEVLVGLTGLLDTNFDEILSFEEVLARFSEDPEWDWSRPAPPPPIRRGDRGW